jgi:hypothetical protein
MSSSPTTREPRHSSRRRFRGGTALEDDIVFAEPRFLSDEPGPYVFVHGYCWERIDELEDFEEPAVVERESVDIARLHEDRLYRCLASRLESPSFDIASSIAEVLESSPAPKSEAPVPLNQPLNCSTYYATDSAA